MRSTPKLRPTALQLVPGSGEELRTENIDITLYHNIQTNVEMLTISLVFYVFFFGGVISHSHDIAFFSGNLWVISTGCATGLKHWHN